MKTFFSFFPQISLHLKWLAFLSVFVPFAGCASIDYYRDAINGHFEIINKAEPIEKIVTRGDTDPELKSCLLKIQKARKFATEELHLPDNGSYCRYADIGRKCVAWNVVATEEFSVSPKEWCFPVAGCVSYKGFFDRAKAKNYAAELSGQGLDTYVAGALAYSTLGWFDDPVLNTMLSCKESHYLSILFHELAHQKLYIENDTSFNEAFATSVAEEGIRRWFARTGDSAAYEEFLVTEKHSKELNDIILNTREKLSSLYRQKITPANMRQKKQVIFQELQNNYGKLKEHWDGDNRYDAWMAKELNNAHLAMVATYHDLVPIFHLLLAQSNGDLKSFYDRVTVISSQPYEIRHQVLKKIYAQKGGWAQTPLSLLP